MDLLSFWGFLIIVNMKIDTIAIIKIIITNNKISINIFYFLYIKNKMFQFIIILLILIFIILAILSTFIFTFVQTNSIDKSIVRTIGKPRIYLNRFRRRFF